jgi:hypothetical protein
MRKLSGLALISLVSTLALAGCDKPAPAENAVEMQTQFAAEDSAGEASSRAPSPPGIAPTAAPGVAFNYRYDFRMDAAKIGETQEKHAQACEKLGIDRCRITGMSYQLINDRDIAGMLAFKLEPSLARQFGKDGIGLVKAAEGMLVRSEINGVDAGSAISAAGRAQGRLRDERTRLEARLKQPKLTEAERAEANSRLEEIARQIESTNVTREENQESLANTPMVFNYGSGEIVPGFDAGSPLRDAFRTAGQTFVGAISVFIVILGALLPLFLLGVLVLGLWRLLRPVARRWQPAKTEPATPPGD